MGEDVQTQLGALNANIKAIFKRLDDQSDMQKMLYKLTTSVELIAREQSGMTASIKGLRDDVDEIKMKPARKWDNYIGYIGTTLLGAALVLLLKAMGIS